MKVEIFTVSLIPNDEEGITPEVEFSEEMQSIFSQEELVAEFNDLMNKKMLPIINEIHKKISKRVEELKNE